MAIAAKYQCRKCHKWKNKTREDKTNEQAYLNFGVKSEELVWLCVKCDIDMTIEALRNRPEFRQPNGEQKMATLKIPSQEIFKIWKEGSGITDPQLKALYEFYRDMLSGMEALGPDYNLAMFELRREYQSIESLMQRRASSNRTKGE